MVEFGFYALSFLMVLTPLYILLRRKAGAYLIGVVLWIVYVTALSTSGILDNFSMPPLVPLLIVIPLIIFILAITGRKHFRQLLESVPDHQLIYIQSFRILVELLIYGAFLNGVYPEIVTFSGINYDIIVGITALLFGYLIQKRMIGRKVILSWNVVSLMILTVTMYSFISTYYFSSYVNEVGNRQFVQLPYIFLPAILLGFAIFYHVASIRKQFSGKGESK